MATWNGIRPTRYYEYMGMAYADTEVSWSYGTVSDTLTLQYKQGEYSDFNHHPPKEFYEHMSKEKALAALEQLADWCNRYEGSEKLDSIINRIKGNE